MLRLTCTALMLALLTTSPWGTAEGQDRADSRLTVVAVQLPGALELADSPAMASPRFMQPSAFTAALRPNRRTGEVLMIVGGAGIVLGILADESVITVAGAGVAGYGLYLYLR